MDNQFNVGDQVIFRNPLYSRLSGTTATVTDVYNEEGLLEYGIRLHITECQDEFIIRKNMLAHPHELVAIPVDVPTQRS